MEDKNKIAQLQADKAKLVSALKDLCGAIDLSKLNVRKDFSLLNAHACALKAIHAAK